MGLTTRGLLIYILIASIVLASARTWWSAAMIDVLLFLTSNPRSKSIRQIIVFGAMVGCLMGLLGTGWYADTQFSNNYVARGAFVGWMMPIGCQVGLLIGGTLSFVLTRFVRGPGKSGGVRPHWEGGDSDRP